MPEGMGSGQWCDTCAVSGPHLSLLTVKPLRNGSSLLTTIKVCWEVFASAAFSDPHAHRTQKPRSRD